MWYRHIRFVSTMNQIWKSTQWKIDIWLNQHFFVILLPHSHTYSLNVSSWVQWFPQLSPCIRIWLILDQKDCDEQLKVYRWLFDQPWFFVFSVIQLAFCIFHKRNFFFSSIFIFCVIRFFFICQPTYAPNQFYNKILFQKTKFLL